MPPAGITRVVFVFAALMVGIATASLPALAMPPATPADDEVPGVAEGVARTLEEFSGADHLIVLMVTAIVVVLVVGVHYEAMRLLVRAMGRLRGRHRLIVVGVILGLVLAHLIEILFFALTYAILEGTGGLGSIHGPTPSAMGAASQGGVDYVYFSAVVYSTVGFGDLVPRGPIRLLAGVEALLGLMLVAWSATFTYTQMHAHWREAFGDT